MESQPQNPEFRNSPENIYPCIDLDEQKIVSIKMLIFSYS